MKKIMMTLAVSLLILSSCSKKNVPVYNIRGEIKGNIAVLEGRKVYLQEIDTISYRSFNYIDTAVVRNGIFTFKKEAPREAIPARIDLKEILDPSENYDDENLLALETGNISIKIDTKKTQNQVQITGTPLNNAFAKYQMEEDKAGDSINSVAYRFALAQIKNKIGIYIFLRNASFLNGPQLKSLLANIPLEYNSYRLVIKAKKRSAALSRTAVGKMYTNIEGKTPNNKAISLSKFIGKKHKYVLLDFWASWCPDCRREIPLLVDTYNKYNKYGLEIIGISLDRDTKAWQNSIKKLSIKWPQMSDLMGWSSKLSETYGVFAIPQLILINNSGIIINNTLTGQTLDNELSKLLHK